VTLLGIAEQQTRYGENRDARLSLVFATTSIIQPKMVTFRRLSYLVRNKVAHTSRCGTLNDSRRGATYGAEQRHG
jgi:hypothetical protein